MWLIFFNFFFSDIIGEIVGMSEITEKDCSGTMSKLLDIQLRDLRLVIACITIMITWYLKLINL